jgi:O-antigen/teichoic acid export membrane protein
MTLRDKLFTPTHIVALQKITQAITGLGTALLVAHFLSPEEQGYFYTMGSLLSSYIIIDLGLSSYLLQRAAELSSGLTIDRLGNIKPEGKQRDELLSFTHWVFKWYRNAGIIAFLVMTPIGLWVLSHDSNVAISPKWLWPWMLIVSAIAINMPTIGFFAVLEGTGKIRETYLLRIAHYIIGAILAWGLIGSGNGLYAQAFPIIATVLVCYAWFFFKYKTILNQSSKLDAKNVSRSIFPHLKFTASIWLSNYTFLNAPVIFSFVTGDIISSGQLGLSIILANIGGAIAMAPITARIPRIIKLLSLDKKKEANTAIRRGLVRFSILFGVGALLLIIAIILGINDRFFSRLINPTDLCLLLITFALFNITNVNISIARAMGNNTLAICSLPIIIAIIPASLTFMSLGSTGIVLAMFLSITPLFIGSLFYLYKANQNI